MSELTDDSILAAVVGGSKAPHKRIDVIARSSSEFRNVDKALPHPPDDRLRRARSEDITGDGLLHTAAVLGMLDAPPENRPVVSRTREFERLPSPPPKGVSHVYRQFSATLGVLMTLTLQSVSSAVKSSRFPRS